MSLALNVIVGKGDFQKLYKLLKMCYAPFDEIVVVIPEDGEACFSAKVKTHRFKWIDDFSAARNHALNNTTSDYVMWLDCDDIPPTADEIFEIKTVLPKYNPDYVLMPYLVGDTGNGYAFQLLRERIFKRAPSVKWVHSIHEQIDLRFTENKFITITNCCVKHDDNGRGQEGLERNIRLLFKEYDSGNTDKHIRFSLAKDLLMSNTDNPEFARLLLEDMVVGHELTDENMAYACNAVAQSYAFDRGVFIPENKNNALVYAHLCMSFGDNMAEPYITIGDYALSDGDTSTAIKNYKHAMTKKAGYSISSISAYGEIPARRLSKTYEAINEIELALYFNRISSKYTNDKSLLEDRKILKGRLV